MSSTKQQTQSDSQSIDYLSDSPLGVSNEKLFAEIRDSWNNIDPGVVRGKEMSIAEVGDLIQYICKGRLYLSEQAKDLDSGWIFLDRAEILHEDSAISRSILLASDWIKAYVARAAAFEDQDEYFQTYRKMVPVINNPRNWRSLREYLWAKLAKDSIGAATIKYSQSPHLLPCKISTQSGLKLAHFNLLTGKLLPFSPSGRFPTLSKLTLPANFTLAAHKSPKSTKTYNFLSNLLGTDGDLEARIEYFWEMMAYFCSYGNPKEIVVVMQGDGGNGKSIWVYLMKEILGELAAKGNKNTYRAGEGDKFGKSEFRNSRFAYFSEIPQGFKLDIDALKEDSEQYIHSQAKNEKGFEKETSHKSIFISNYPIEIPDRTTATYSRLHYIVTKGKNWRESPDRIERFNDILWGEERDYILYEMVEGYKRLDTRKGFKVPKEYSGNSDEIKDHTASGIGESVEEFIASRIMRDSECELRASELAEQFEKFCKLNGLPYNERVKLNLYKTLTGMNIIKRRDTRGMIYEGIRFTDALLGSVEQESLNTTKGFEPEPFANIIEINYNDNKYQDDF